MKKIFSLALVLIMLLSLCVCVSAGENATVEVQYMEMPTVDGVVEDIWGDPVVTISPSNPQTQYIYKDKELANEPEQKNLDVDVYLGWNETYLFMALVTNEPDEHIHLDTSRGNMWNGDYVQIALDAAGANSMGGFKGDATSSCFPVGTPELAISRASEGDKKKADWDFGVLDGEQHITGMIYEVLVDAENHKTVYELAIPHTYIFGKGEAGYEYGCTIGRISHSWDWGNGYNEAVIVWGDGLAETYRDDSCGMNALILTGGAAGDSAGGNQDTADLTLVTVALTATLALIGFAVSRKLICRKNCMI